MCVVWVLRTGLSGICDKGDMMRYIGLDVGTKRIGVAVSDGLTITAQGLESYTVSGNPEQDRAYLIALAQQYAPYTFVLGLPKNMNGTQGPMAQKVREFGRDLKEHSGAPIVFWDERLTTVSAEKALLEANVSRKKRRKVVDKLAAVIILQGFLDSL